MVLALPVKLCKLWKQFADFHASDEEGLTWCCVLFEILGIWYICCLPNLWPSRSPSWAGNNECKIELDWIVTDSNLSDEYTSMLWQRNLLDACQGIITLTVTIVIVLWWLMRLLHGFAFVIKAKMNELNDRWHSRREIRLCAQAWGCNFKWLHHR